MKTVCILYGFCEGPRVSKRFRTELEKLGFSVISDASRADIIIGHSGGCFLLPQRIKARHIVQIGLVYWPGRSIFGSLTHKLITDVKNHHRKGAISFWLRKTFWNAVYFFRPIHLVRMLIGRNRGLHWKCGTITTVIRPSLDSFCTPDLGSLPFKQKPTFITIPGQHDDCWRDPKPYLDLLKN